MLAIKFSTFSVTRGPAGSRFSKFEIKCHALIEVQRFLGENATQPISPTERYCENRGQVPRRPKFALNTSPHFRIEAGHQSFFHCLPTDRTTPSTYSMT